MPDNLEICACKCLNHSEVNNCDGVYVDSRFNFVCFHEGKMLSDFKHTKRGKPVTVIIYKDTHILSVFHTKKYSLWYNLQSKRQKKLFNLVRGECNLISC